MEYDAKIDSKKRITIRSAETKHYHVKEYDNGVIILEPRYLVTKEEYIKLKGK